MRRSIAFAVLSFLLLYMQQEAQVHAMTHLGPQLARKHQTELVAPSADAACVECALLAAGTHAAHGHDLAIVAELPPTERARAPFRSRATDAPAYFQSRAPPVLA
jgi:hypothetical protein